jgi:hypothetical protein
MTYGRILEMILNYLCLPLLFQIQYIGMPQNTMVLRKTLGQIQFSSNDGNETLSYCDFVTLVREVYAGMIALIKMKLILLRLLETSRVKRGVMKILTPMFMHSLNS